MQAPACGFNKRKGSYIDRVGVFRTRGARFALWVLSRSTSCASPAKSRANHLASAMSCVTSCFSRGACASRRSVGSARAVQDGPQPDCAKVIQLSDYGVASWDNFLCGEVSLGWRRTAFRHQTHQAIGLTNDLRTDLGQFSFCAARLKQPIWRSQRCRRSFLEQVASICRGRRLAYRTEQS